MKKYLFFLVFCWLFSCAEKPATQQEKKTAPKSLDYTDLPDFSALNAKADTLVKTWEAFNALDQRMTALKRVVSVPDLKMLLAELIEKEGAILKNGYPADFNTPEVKSRQRLLKTYLFKTQAVISQSQDPKAATLEIITSYNALREQLNRHTKATLNLKDLEDAP